MVEETPLRLFLPHKSQLFCNRFCNRLEMAETTKSSTKSSPIFSTLIEHWAFEWCLQSALSRIHIYDINWYNTNMMRKNVMIQYSQQFCISSNKPCQSLVGTTMNNRSVARVLPRKSLVNQVHSTWGNWVQVYDIWQSNFRPGSVIVGTCIYTQTYIYIYIYCLYNSISIYIYIRVIYMLTGSGWCIWKWGILRRVSQPCTKQDETFKIIFTRRCMAPNYLWNKEA